MQYRGAAGASPAAGAATAATTAALPKRARWVALAFLLGIGGLWGWAFWNEKQVRPEATLVTVDRAPVRSLQFSPDGSALLVSAVGVGRRGGARGGVQLVRDANRSERELPQVRAGAFGTVAWRRLRVLRVHRGEPADMGPAFFSPDGATLATVSGQVTLWSADTGRAVRTFKAGRRVAAWTPDSGALAWQNGTGDVLIQEAETGRLRLVFRPEPETLVDLIVTPDGTALAARDRAGRVTVYDAATGARRAVADSPPALSLAVAPDGTLALGAADGQVRLCDPGTGRVLRTVPPPALPSAPVTAVAFGPGGRLATGDATGRARVYGGTAGATTDFPHAAGGEDPSVRSLAFSPDGTRLATGGENGQVYVWRLLLTR